MLINELNENFYYACIKYTLDNSNANVVGDYSLFHNQCGRTLDDSGNIIINFWNIDSVPQPTQDDLLAYNLIDLNDTIDLHNDFQELNNQTKVVITNHIANLTPYVNNGTLLYDTNESKLKLWISGSWTNIN